MTLTTNRLLYSMFGWVEKFKMGGKMLKEGTPAPKFTVSTHQGKTVTLADFAGKNIILWFYPKADTPG